MQKYANINVLHLMRLVLFYSFLVCFLFKGYSQCRVDWDDWVSGMSYSSCSGVSDCGISVEALGVKPGATINGEKSVCLAKADTASVRLGGMDADSLEFFWSQAYSAAVAATVFVNGVESGILTSSEKLAVERYVFVADPGDTIVAVEIRQNTSSSGQINIGTVHVYSGQYQAQPTSCRYGDIIVSEFMADPEPCVYLPNCEYIELFNNGADTVNLADFDFFVGTSSYALPRYLLAPHALVVLNDGCLGAELPFFDMADFPSLNNEGFVLALKNAGNIVFSCEFDRKQYDEIKTDGGWSLERTGIDVGCPYKYSENPLGGTPGEFDSVARCETDPVGIMSVLPVDSHALRIFFSGIVDSSRFAPSGVIAGNLPADNVVWTAPLYTECVVRFADALPAEGAFEVCIDEFYTYSSTEAYSYCGLTGFASYPSPGDIFIEEILFDTDGAIAEFVEITNVSDSIFNLSDICIARFDEHGALQGSCAGIRDRLLFPDSVVAIAKSSEGYAEVFKCVCPHGIVETETMPALPNDGGSIAIVTRGLSVVDSAVYSEQMHSYGLDDTENISLVICKRDRAFHSSSANCNYASPGCKSCAETTEPKQGALVSAPPYFSPDGDGIDDILDVLVSASPEETIDVMIFTENGQLCSTIAESEVGCENLHLQWDGYCDNKKQAPSGIYVIFAVTYRNGRKHDAEKKTTVLLR